MGYLSNIPRILCGIMLLVTFAVGAVPAHALTSGTKTTGILTGGGTQTYSFSGTAGQSIMLFGYSPNFLVRMNVFKPDGSSWTGSSDYERILKNLPVTGTYTVEIYQSPGTSGGAFDLYYLRGDDSVSGGGLTSGQTVNSSIDANGIASYTFNGTAGQGIMLHANASYTTYIRVFKPDGSVSTWGYNRIVTTLPDTGTYTVAVYGKGIGASGAFNLSYLRGGDGVSNGEITSGQTLNASINANGIASYIFEGTAGKQVTLHANASYNTIIRVFRPDGSSWTWGYNRIYSSTLPNTGTYTVAVYGKGTEASGPLTFRFFSSDDSVSSGTLISGSERSGYMPINGLDSYKFSGSQGNSVSISVADGGAFTKRLRVYKPDGTTWTSSPIDISGTLPATGEYSLVVRTNGIGGSGAYTVTATTTPLTVAASDPEKAGCMTVGPCQPGGGPAPYVGNPINFDIGYKMQDERDYSGGLLALSRLYRSDSTWTDNTFGERWRHNYARSLDVTGSAASITDGTGAVTTFTEVGSDWVADDSDITATFEAISGGYIYTLPDNTREIYEDTNDRLTRIEYIGGGAVDLTYNGGGNLETVTDENDRTLTFSYTSGRVTSVVTPIGTFSYDYDADGNLIEVEAPDTTTREYHYEDTNFDHALTGITDEEGVRFATWAYDAQGRATLSKHAGDVEEFEVTYNADGSVTTTNPLNKETTYYFTNINDLRRIVQVDRAASTDSPAATRYYNYYTNGWLMNETDWEGNVTAYIRDSLGRVTQMVEAQGEDDERITNTTWHSTLNLPETITIGDQKTSYVYDAHGRVTSATVTDLGITEDRTTTYAYYPNTTDANGNTILGRVDTITHPNSAETEFTYNTDLLVETVTRAAGKTYEQELAYTYDTEKRIETITELNGTTTTLTYDTLGRLETTTKADGTALEATTTYAYDNNGNVTSIALPNSVTLSYDYDNAQRLTEISDSLGNTITYTLDDAGNIEVQQYKNATPTLTYTHSWAYDELSRTLESIGAASQTSEYAYDNNSNLTSYTDAKTNDTTYAYDALNRLVKETDDLAGETDFFWTELDDTKMVTDARDNTTEYFYNAFGEVEQEASPDSGATYYSYNASGDIVARTDARAKVTEYSYDLLNRITAVEYLTDSSNDVSYTYDSCTNGAGLLCSVTDASGSKAYEYDLLGRVTKVTETRGALSFVTEYGYDLAGNMTDITLPSGREISYTLNANGQVSAVAADVAGSPVTLASSITYLPFGPLNGLTYGNTLAFSAGFDQDYNPTSRAVSSIFSDTYDTDQVGNITQRGSVTFDYDALNRLDEEDDGSATTYTYDATHNRLTKVDGSTLSTTVPTTSNKISAVGADSYSYDAAGNITDDGAREYVWDDAGRLKEVEISSATVGAYTYNASNQRAIKVASSVTTHYIYGAGGLLYGEYDSAGDMIREYIYLNGEPLTQINDGSPETPTYLHTDNLGTPRYGTSAAGSQVWAWDSDAFGNAAPSGSVTVNLRMAGQYHDAETGLLYNWNRYYNPEIGRYVSSDPIGLEGGINTFNYVEQNPLLYTDPTGEAIPLAFVGGAAVITTLFSTNPANAPGSNGEVLVSDPARPYINGLSVGVAGGLCRPAAGAVIRGITSTTGAAKYGLQTIFKVRPNDVPKHWIKKAAQKEGSVKWVDPKNPHNYVRQRRDGTITQVKNGRSLDNKGNYTNKLNDTNAHGIKREDFIFRE